MSKGNKNEQRPKGSTDGNKPRDRVAIPSHTGSSVVPGKQHLRAFPPGLEVIEYDAKGRCLVVAIRLDRLEDDLRILGSIARNIGTN